MIITAARAWIGTPYHDQASVRGVGCDCLGLARGVWRDVIGDEPLPVPAYARDWGEVGQIEMLSEACRRSGMTEAHEPVAGALVLFRMRENAIAKHCAICAGQTLIHAREKLGVIEEPFTSAWRRRLAFVFLFPLGAD